MDPRKYQVFILLILLVFGNLSNKISLPGFAYPLVIASTLMTQFLFARIRKIDLNFWSAGISALSLLLLFRVDAWWGWIAVSIICIGSKFMFQHQGKHIFNPSNIAIVLMLVLLPDQAWISPGQWGRELWLVALLLFLGTTIVTSAKRLDTTFFFLLSYGAMLLTRHLWLGDPLRIPWHKMTNGSLLIFSFLMISDPRTTPDSRLGRLIFCVFVAGIAFYLQNFQYNREGLFYALTLGSLTLPIINTLLPGEVFQWEKWRPETSS